MTTNANNREVIRFTKMHGIGNDYIYIDCMSSIPERLPELAREMSDRHMGVGGDGIVLICPSATADFRMRMFNNDGSEARMCGNASRCIARYVHDHNLSSNNPLSLETLSGIKALSLNIKDGDIVESVTVDMGVPSMNKAEIPVDVSGENVVEMTVETPYGPVEVTAVSMGNPHGVIFVDDLASIPFDDLGPYMESHPMWPDRANIEFAQVLNDREIRMRVWERGTGETLACGTGACATAVAGVLTGCTGREVTLRLRGGDLDIKWREEDGHVLMTGPATEVFTGEYRRQS
ncbi:diaminopimelate epimerase [uncultured Duncaniella sp.]|uniref:diaminopimelate epimerase n=1 Tax=uncultured Duncaniella sp. TaxID=2768039 RepID=UPI0026748C2D|nr:diaminopimelate epimerase [uncultured Duncaniella sp.]